MLLGWIDRLNSRPATTLRLVGLAALLFWQTRAQHPAGLHGRGLAITVFFAGAAIAWIVWSWHVADRSIGAHKGLGWELVLLGVCGGLLIGSSESGPGNVFVFVAAFSSGVRFPPARALVAVGPAILAVCASWVVYDTGGAAVLAYAFGLLATMFGGGQRRDITLRHEQAELLLAQSQRSHEEQLRAAKLEESGRIAREIHDVLAHALAGLTIQLEATAALIEGGADSATILPRVRRAHALARDGLRETRLAVGALRTEGSTVIPAASRIETLVSDFRAAGGEVVLRLDGAREHLVGPAADAAVRIIQESLTNVTKHAPGAAVNVRVQAGPPLSVAVASRVGPTVAGPRSSLSDSGGGYGIAGMRERTEELGGSFRAGPSSDGWLVQAELPAESA